MSSFVNYLTILELLRPGTEVPWQACVLLLMNYANVPRFAQMSCFISPRDLRAPSADRRETLSHDRKLVEFYNTSLKIRGPLPKIGSKTCKNGAVSYNFRLWSPISSQRFNISKIQKKTNVSTTIPLAFGEKGPVNFGSLTTQLEMCILTHPKAKSTSSEDHISAPIRGAATSNFTRACVWPKLASAHQTGDGGLCWVAG